MILITGSLGFIGLNLTAKMRELGISYIGYDLVDGDDIRDQMKLDKLFETNNFDTVIHLAALAGVRRGELYPEEYLSTNVLGTDNVLKMAEKYAVGKFILFSSSSALNPISFYGMTKAVGEMLPKRYKIPVTIVRPYTVYGENGRKDQVIMKWLGQIKAGKPVTFYGDGTTSRGYTYVGDLLQGIMKLLELEPMSETFDLGGKQVISLAQLLGIFRDELGNFPIESQRLPNADVKESKADLTKAKKLLGFNPKTDFEAKVREIINLYK